MKSQFHRLNAILVQTCFSPLGRFLLKLFLALFVTGVSLDVLADDGGDLLQGTTTSATATLSGTGKIWIYIIEGVVAIVTYIKTKNIVAFLGVIVLSIFITYLLTLTGGSSV